MHQKGKAKSFFANDIIWIYTQEYLAVNLKTYQTRITKRTYSKKKKVYQQIDQISRHKRNVFKKLTIAWPHEQNRHYSDKHIQHKWLP